jgi:glycosyltransferase involved in cell wall biosynthesis
MLGRVARWLDSYLVRHADCLIFDTRQHLEYFRTLSAARLPSSCVVPVGARPIGAARQNPSRSHRLVVVFAGSYVPLQGAPVIARAAAFLRDDPVDFTMIGTGQEFPEVARIVRENNLVNVNLVGWVPLEVLDDWYHRAEIVLGIFGPTAKTQRVIPNKVFEALSIGQPVITSDTPAIRELFVPGREMICCTADDPASLAEAIRWVYVHREEAQGVGRAGRAAFERHASDSALAEALRPVFAWPDS